MKKLLILFMFTILSKNGISGTFTSIASGAWNNPATWTFSGDADGVPDSDDDVTVSAGHTVSVGATFFGRNLVVDGTISISTFGLLYVAGNYTLNGAESGNGSMGFIWAAVSTISGSGSFSQTIRYSFSGNNKSIAAGTVIVKSTSTSTSIGNNITVRNFGSLTLGPINAGNSNSTFFNEATGTLAFRVANHFNSAFQIDASTPGNTVNFSFSDASGRIKSPIGNTFHHLIISGNTTKLLSTSTTVNGNFTCTLGSGFNYNSFNLNIKGNISMGSTSYTQQSASTLTLDGTSTQTFAYTGAATSIIPHLVINNAAGVNTTAGIISITEDLTVQAGNFNLGANRITLSSNAVSTARIAQSNGTFSGTMTIQRFIDARADGYSDMSSPIAGATFNELNDDMALLFGAYTPSFTPSCWGYSESAWDYVAITSVGNAMAAGTGYEVYLDNDGLIATSFSPTTVDFIGTPNVGDVTVGLTVNNDGWNLIGNPYASFLDWVSFRASAGVAMNASYMVYDEVIEDFVSSAIDIAPSQGFWVEATAAGTATFRETNKSVSTSSTFREMDELLFSLRVSTPLTQFTSNTYFKFDPNASSYYEFDHDLSFLKVPHPKAPSLFTHSSDGKRLRINELINEDNMVIPVTFIPGVEGEYKISAINIESALNLGYSQVILEDKLLGIFYDLTRGDYEFSSNLGDKENRFNLHLKSANNSDLLNNEEISFINSAQGVFVNFNLDENKAALIDVYNVAGQEIMSGIRTNTDAKIVGITIPNDYHGMYIIRVLIDEKVITKRYFKN